MRVNFNGMMEELWDEFSFYVDGDDIESLSGVAGMIVIRRIDYDKLVKKLSNLLGESPLPSNDEDEFEKYIVGARDAFVQAINLQEWSSRLRLQAEDLLIAYDQMRDKLFTRK